MSSADFIEHLLYSHALRVRNKAFSVGCSNANSLNNYTNHNYISVT